VTIIHSGRKGHEVLKVPQSTTHLKNKFGSIYPEGHLKL